MEGAVTLGEFITWLSKVEGDIDKLPTEELKISRKGLSQVRISSNDFLLGHINIHKVIDEIGKLQIKYLDGHVEYENSRGTFYSETISKEILKEWEENADFEIAYNSATTRLLGVTCMYKGKFPKNSKYAEGIRTQIEEMFV